MKKLTNWVFITIFFVISFVPFLGMLVTPSASVSGNEILASGVSLTDPDGAFNADILSDISDYIADRFALRQVLVNCWSWLHTNLLQTSTNDDVILGTDSWLYYTPTTNDYTGVAMSDAELLCVVENLKIAQEWAAANNAVLYFTVAPNKNTLYPENMPDYFANAHESANLSRLVPLMEEHGINYIDLVDPLRQQSGLYYPSDTHWNTVGAAIAADVICEKIGIDTDFGSRTFIADGVHKGDLYEMLYPYGAGTDTHYALQGGFSFTAVNNANNGNAIRILTENASPNGRLLCYRDSFGNDLYPYLAEVFTSATFSRASTYDLSSLSEGKYDVVIIQIVERNIPQLAQSDVFVTGT